MIPDKIANAWVATNRTDNQTFFGYKNGSITIGFQKNVKADKETIYNACIQALNKHFDERNNHGIQTESV